MKQKDRREFGLVNGIPFVFYQSPNCIMVADPPPSMTNGANDIAAQSAGRSIPSSTSSRKVPKKENKAMREKMKRDHLNELFLELEPTRQNNGKASILVDVARLLRDLLAQVEALRKENVALVNESRYVTGEKNMLQDGKTVLKSEVEQPQNELHERMQCDPMAESQDRSDYTSPNLRQLLNTTIPMQQQLVGPLYDIALRQDLSSLRDAGTSPSSPKVPSKVSRPHARYPTPSNTWSLELLSRST